MGVSALDFIQPGCHHSGNSETHYYYYYFLSFLDWKFQVLHVHFFETVEFSPQKKKSTLLRTKTENCQTAVVSIICITLYKRKTKQLCLPLCHSFVLFLQGPCEVTAFISLLTPKQLLSPAVSQLILHCLFQLIDWYTDHWSHTSTTAAILSLRWK